MRRLLAALALAAIVGAPAAVGATVIAQGDLHLDCWVNVGFFGARAGLCNNQVYTPIPTPFPQMDWIRATVTWTPESSATAESLFTLYSIHCPAGYEPPSSRCDDLDWETVEGTSPVVLSLQPVPFLDDGLATHVELQVKAGTPHEIIWGLDYGVAVLEEQDYRYVIEHRSRAEGP